MSLKKDIIGAEVQIGSNEAQKSLVDLSQKTAELTNKNEMLRKSMTGLKAIGKEQSDEYKALSKEVRENTKTINANQSQMDALRKTIGLSDMTMKQLRGQAINLRKELNSMNQGADPARWAQLNSQLVATERQMNMVRSSIGETRGFMGQLGNSLTSIPGPIGAVIQSIAGMGKALWALVANPIGATIAAIVVSLMLLYKAFTSTDSGANAMEGTLKAIGNVMDILIDRAMSYYKMLWSLVTFDWEGVKKNAKDAFGGIVSQIKDATSAGWDYVQVMDGIDDREAAAQTRMSKLRAEIELLKNQSKDANKTTKEKNDLIDQAMAKEIELFGIEKGFMKERTSAEVSNLASKINNSKLSMEQKKAQLEQWLATDDKELDSMMEKDAAFAEFVNKNEEGFQALQKMKAEEFQKDADFQTETRRLQKSASSEKKALMDEEKARVEAAHKKAFDQLEIDNRKELNIIKQQRLDKLKAASGPVEKKQVEVDNNAQVLAQEVQFLNKKLALQKKYGEDYTATEAELLEKSLNAQEELDKKTADDKKKLYDKELKDLKNKGESELAQVRKDALDEGLSEEESNALLIAKEIEFLNYRLALQKKYGEDTTETQTAITAKLNELAVNALKGDEDRLKELADLKKKYDDDEISAKQEKDNALAALDKAQKDGLIKSEEEYTRLKKEINKKYEQSRLEKAIETGQKISQVLSIGSDLVKTLMDSELASAGDNEEKKLQIRKKYANAQFLVSAAQIVVNTAVAIMQGFAQLGLIGGAIAAVLLTATGAVQLSIANKERQKMMGGKKAGGYTDTAASDDKVVDFVHSNEFVANAQAKRNPTVKPYLDVINLAQENGTIGTLNLAAVMGSGGLKSGGYSSTSSSAGSASSSPVIIQSGSNISDHHLEKFNSLLETMQDWNPELILSEFERKRDNWKKTTTGGLK